MPARPARLVLALGVVLLFGAGPAAGRGPIRLDRYGDLLPPGARARLGSLRFRTSSSLGPLSHGRSLHVSPDGRTLALDDLPGVVRLLDTASGKELRRVRAGCFGRFSPDDRLMATGNGDGTIDLWEVATGKRLLRLPGHEPTPVPPGDEEWRRAYLTLESFQMAFSGDAKSLASWGGDRTWRRWDVASGKELRAWRPKARKGDQFVLSPDARTLLERGEGGRRLRLWDAATGKELRTLPSQGGPVVRSEWSPDGRRLALVTEEATLHLLAVESGRELWKVERCVTVWEAFSFSPDGKVVITGEQGVRVLHAATGREIRTLPGVAQGAASLAVLPDGKTLAAQVGAVVRFWDLTTGKERSPPQGHTDVVQSLAFAPRGKVLASASADGAVRLWEVAGGRTLRVLRGRVGFGGSLCVSPDGKGVADWGWSCTSAAQWELARGGAPRRFMTGGGLGSPDVAFAFSPDGKTLAVTGASCEEGEDDGEGSVRLHDRATGKVLRTLPVESGNTTLAYLPDGKALAVGGWPGEDSLGVSLWDVTSGRRLRAFPGWQSYPPYALALSPDGKLLAAGDRGSLVVWEVATGREVADRFDRASKREVLALVFTPRGELLALVNEYELGHRFPAVAVWDVLAGRRRYRVTDPATGFSCAALAPDGRMLATGHPNGTILLWDVPAPERSPELRLGDREKDQLWADLAGADAARAFGAVRTLTASPRQAVALLAARLRPAPASRVAKWIADLDSDSFEDREAASAALARLGAEAEPALRAALRGQPSVEARRRARELLRGLPEGPRPPAAEELRAIRAVQALEQIGTPAARRLLEALAKGAAEARLTREARAALGRLAP